MDWPGYDGQRRDSGPGESIVTGRAAIDGGRTEGRYVVIAGRFEFLGGSMGAVHGERVVRAYRRAAIERLPVVVISTSGGARVQEGMVALVQLARTAAAARAHSHAGMLSLAVLRNPTTGGVLASYASLTDLRAAEPGAAISFAGSRELAAAGASAAPSTAEIEFSQGRVDALVARADEARWIELAMGLRDERLRIPPVAEVGTAEQLELLNEEVDPWTSLQRIRAATRWTGIDHAAALCDSWTELRGTDPVVRAGLARIGAHPVVVVAHDRRAGRGYVGVGGFRLARRAMDLADRLRIPLLTLVDTPGADPGAEGVGAEIAATIAALLDVRVPTVAVCVGEGGSGGALAFAACDRLLMLEHAVFTVLAPEGVAAVLSRGSADVPDLAKHLGIRAADVHRLGIADTVVSESEPGAVAEAVRTALAHATVGDRLARLDLATKRWLR